MGQPVAKCDDRVVGVDVHIEMMPSPGGPIPTTIPSPFTGKLNDKLASSVYADNQLVALLDSTAENSPKHIPSVGPFQKTPSDKGRVSAASSKVFADNRGVARLNDPVECCNDPQDANTAMVIASGSVLSG